MKLWVICLFLLCLSLFSKFYNILCKNIKLWNNRKWQKCVFALEMPCIPHTTRLLAALEVHEHLNHGPATAQVPGLSLPGPRSSPCPAHTRPRGLMGAQLSPHPIQNVTFPSHIPGQGGRLGLGLLWGRGPVFPEPLPKHNSGP